MSVVAYIGIGSNQGERRMHCAEAMAQIAASTHTRILACSSWYRTEPWGYSQQDDFINLVIKTETELRPRPLLAFLKGIEKKLGRRRTFLFGPRIIDLDILFYGDRIMRTREFTIPHPRLCERGFVLVPLNELAPQLIHPVYGQTVSSLLAALDDHRRVLPLGKDDP